MKQLLLLFLFLPILLTAQNRLALIIGNAEYKELTDIPSAKNDLADMEVLLKECKFEVIKVPVNATRAEMEKAITDFGVKLKKQGGVGLFYYSGHGFEYGYKNYMIPIDFPLNIQLKTQIERAGVPLSLVKDNMLAAANGENIILLDACRTEILLEGDAKAPRIGSNINPGEFKDVSNVFVGYATNPNNEAIAGQREKNSPFTEALIQVIREKKGEELMDVYRNVMKTVQVKYPQQHPTPEGITPTPFYFFPKDINRIEYDKLKPKCDASFAKQEWIKAQGCYEIMQDYLPTDRYVKDQIAACEANIKADNARFVATNPTVQKEPETKPEPSKPPIQNTQPKPTISPKDLPEFVDMVKVDSGTFQMGRENGESDEKPVHSVTLSSYYIGRTEVTQAQWKEIMGNNPSYHKLCKDCPVEQVSWNDIQNFLKKLNEKYPNKNYRLPTEAEWEFAARGGNNSRGYPYSGSNHLDSVAWYNSNSSGKTHPVGQKTANELGIYDMSGNVWEWCSDWYGSYSSSAETNPKGASSGSYRVFRGGSWYNFSNYCASANRSYDTPTDSDDNLGFRLSRTE